MICPKCERLWDTYSYVLKERSKMLLAAELTGDYDHPGLRDREGSRVLCARHFERMRSPIARKKYLFADSPLKIPTIHN